MIARVGVSLERKLAAMRHWWRTTSALSGLAWTVGVVLAIALLCYHSDRFTGGLSVPAREAWRIVIVLGGLTTLAVALLRPLFRRLPDAALAAQVEQKYPVLRERLLTTIDLVPALGTAGASGRTSAGFSRAMVSALAEETRLASADLDFRRAVNLQPLRTAFVFAAITLFVLAIDVFRAPDAFQNWLNRILYPRADVAPWADTRVWIAPGADVLPRGAGLAVTITTKGEPAERAMIRYRQEGDPADAWKTIELKSPTKPKSGNSTRTVSADIANATGEERQFTHRFPALGQTVIMYATANDGKSNEKTVRVEDRPTLLNSRLKLHFPSYMKRPDQTLPETTGNIAAPVGTEVEIVATANKPLKTAQFVQNEKTVGPWKVEGEKVNGKLSVWKDGTYRLELTDNHGFGNPSPPRHEIRAMKDETPTVHINRPGTDMELVPNGNVPLLSQAIDDYGITRMNLVYEKSRGEAYRGTSGARSARGSLLLPDTYDHIRKGEKTVKVSEKWSIASVKAQPGDILTYHVAATDTDTLSGPHIGRSSRFRVRVVSLLEMQNKLKELLDEEARNLAQLRARQVDAQRQLQEARVKPKVEAMSKAQEAQRAVAQETRSATQRMESLSSQLENNNLATKSELDRRSEAQKTLEKLAGQKMPQAADSIQKAQNAKQQAQNGNQKSQDGQQNPQGQQNQQSPSESLQQADKQETAIRKDIEKAQNLLSRTPTPQQLAQEAQRLAQEQQRLADSARFQAEDMRGTRQQTGSDKMTPEQKNGLEMARRQQAQTSADTQRLQEQIQRAQQSAQERGNKKEADALQKAAQALKQGDARGNQQQAQQALQKNNPGAAASPQDKAAAALEKAAQAAQQAAQETNPDSAQAAAERLEQAADKLRGMAREQREIAKQVGQNPNAQQSQKLSQQERNLQQQSGQMQQQLQNAQQAQQSLQNAQQNLGQSSQQLQQNNSQSAQSPAQKAAQQLDQAAQQAQNAAQQLRQQQAAQEMAEKVERIARTQRALQQTTQRLENGKKDGLDANEQRELGQVAERQRQTQQQARDLSAQFPSPAFQQALDMAARQMQPATQNLNQSQPNTSGETQQAQGRAAQTLETVAKALQQQAGGQQGQQQQQQSGQQQQGNMSAQQAQQQAALGELMLAQGLQQQLRQETGSLDQSRQSNPNQQLNPGQERQANQLTQGQKTTRDIARNAAQQLGQMPGVGEAIQQATQEMGQAANRLGQQETGKPTQGNQDNALRNLDQAVRQAQQQMQQQQQQQQAQQNGQQGMPQPNGQQRGNDPNRKAFTRLEEPKKGKMSAADPRAGRFADLDPRTQRTLREGQQERAPAEYQDLVSRYYKALAEKKR